LRSTLLGLFMHALAISTLVVAVAEMGDKTQLLALILATRFKQPIPIILGMLAATILNHLAAAFAGELVAAYLPHDVLRWGLGASFIAMGIWVLIPDKIDDKPKTTSRYGAFLTTVVAFFLLEIGDKTQIATIALAARFQDVALVTTGTVLGMMIADVPAVFLGEWLSRKIPMKLMHSVAAVIFIILGALTLANVGDFF
jgi:Ca2+/H+ antiporter, TMEM165/GDT1 family